MLGFLSILLLAGHLLCMNVASGGPLLCVWLGRRRFRESQPESHSVTLRLACWSNWLLLLGALLGVAVGGISHFAGDTAFGSIVPLFRYKIGWGLVELICSASWMFGYWFWLRYRPPTKLVSRLAHGSLPILSATNLLYHFPTLLTVMSKTARGELSLSKPVDAAIFRELAFRQDVMAHSVHFALASLAVSGVFLFWLARTCSNAQRFFVVGARLALVATVLQFPAGLWLVFASPPVSQARLVGGDPWVATLFLASLFCAFYLLQNLSVLALGDFSPKLPPRCAALLGLTVFLMTGTLYLLRH